MTRLRRCPRESITRLGWAAAVLRTMRVTLDGDYFELTPELVRAKLRGHAPETIRDYWVEIDGTRWPVKQVISLATGVRERRRFQSQSSRRWLSNLGFAVRSAREGALDSARSVPSSLGVSEPRITAELPDRDLVLVGCVKSKRSSGAPAKDLYTSDYFVKMRTYAEATRLPWFILSAEHGLVRPNEWLEPYERYLPETSDDYRRAWGVKVAVQLEEAVGPLAGLVVDVHAGGVYVGSLRGPLQQRGVQVIDQLSGLSFGRRLSWYLQREGAGPANARGVVSRLRDRESARTLTAVLETGGAGLRVPGLYSWWVDAEGAADLSSGLGYPFEPGLIYAGLAGATRSGGSTSGNTLWGRIATMHLGKKHDFSTLRLSIGSILASAYEQPAIDEVQLTRWMHAHLRILAIPIADADSLGDLETEVLAALNPPLNLAKVAKSPIRHQLSALRKQYGSRSLTPEGADHTSADDAQPLAAASKPADDPEGGGGGGRPAALVVTPPQVHDRPMNTTWSIGDLMDELERFEREAREAGLKENSVRTYVDRSRYFVRWLAGDFEFRGPQKD